MFLTKQFRLRKGGSISEVTGSGEWIQRISSLITGWKRSFDFKRSVLVGSIPCCWSCL